MSSQKRVAIIGAGISGLAQADVFARCGFSVVLFERATRVGGVWACSYPEVSLQNTWWGYHLSCLPWPFVPNVHPTGAAGHPAFRYLDALVASARGFDIRLEHEVTSAREAADGRWILRVQSRSGEVPSEHFDHLVVSVGQYTEGKHRPHLAGESDFAGVVMTERDIGDLSRFDGKRVVVVGFGKSALDMASVQPRRARHRCTTSSVHTALDVACAPDPRRALHEAALQLGLAPSWMTASLGTPDEWPSASFTSTQRRSSAVSGMDSETLHAPRQTRGTRTRSGRRCAHCRGDPPQHPLLPRPPFPPPHLGAAGDITGMWAEGTIRAPPCGSRQRVPRRRATVERRGASSRYRGAFGRLGHAAVSLSRCVGAGAPRIGGRRSTTLPPRDSPSASTPRFRRIQSRLHARSPPAEIGMRSGSRWRYGAGN